MSRSKTICLLILILGFATTIQGQFREGTTTKGNKTFESPAFLFNNSTLKIEHEINQSDIEEIKNALKIHEAIVNITMDSLSERILNYTRVQQQHAETISKAFNELLTLKEPISQLIEKVQPTQKLKFQKSFESTKIATAASTEATKEFVFDETLNCIRECGNQKSLPRKCVDALDKNQQKSDVYVLNPLTTFSPFGAFCKRYDNKNWLIIQRRQDGSVDFYRNWENYKNGFGNVNGEYWLGLERLHKLTAEETYELWIEMATNDNELLTARYMDFSVASENKNYKLTIGGFIGDRKDDPLAVQNGMNFSTYDKDNDISSNYNCANQQRGAWWYHDCSLSNLNGEYTPMTEEDGKGLWWYHGSVRSLKYVHMAIHPTGQIKVKNN